MSETIITADDLSVHFPLGGKLFGPKPVVRAVEGVTVHIEKGSFYGLVGESGSGKTTFGRALLRAVPITRGSATYTDSEVTYDLTAIKGDELKEYRKKAQVVRLQYPLGSLLISDWLFLAGGLKICFSKSALKTLSMCLYVCLYVF